MNEQTTDTREEVELPPLELIQEDDLRAIRNAGYEMGGNLAGELSCRERQLRASILACKKAEAANREKDAEIERLKDELFTQQDINEAYERGKENGIISFRASLGEKSHIFWPCADGFHEDCTCRKQVECACRCHKSPAPPTKDKE